MRVEIDGNDGTGKSTLVANLARYGIVALDRGRMTKATDDDSVEPEEGVLYIHLDAPAVVCQERLTRAGKDTSEKYHTLDDLRHYERRFQEVALRFRAKSVMPRHPTQTLLQVLSHMQGKNVLIGLPKGRLQEVADAFLAGIGVTFPWEATRGYARALHHESWGAHAFRLKPRSIPQMVAMGHLDVGIVGRDVLLDSIHADLLEVRAATQEPSVRLVAAAENPNILKLPPERPIVVATEYPNVVDRWLTDLGVAHVILHTHGSTEAFCPRFADMVVDVVDTGATLEANGLVPIHEFLTSTAVLISRKGDDSLAVRVLSDALEPRKA